MTFIGNYIFLKAENYEKMGGSRNMNHPKSVTEKLFQGHHNHVLALAEKFKVDNLQDLERQYNRANSE